MIVWLCVSYFEAFRVESCLDLCPRVFHSYLALCSSRSGKRVSRAFVCSFCTHRYMSFFTCFWCQVLAACGL